MNTNLFKYQNLLLSLGYLWGSLFFCQFSLADPPWDEVATQRWFDGLPVKVQTSILSYTGHPGAVQRVLSDLNQAGWSIDEVVRLNDPRFLDEFIRGVPLEREQGLLIARRALRRAVRIRSAQTFPIGELSSILYRADSNKRIRSVGAEGVAIGVVSLTTDMTTAARISEQTGSPMVKVHVPPDAQGLTVPNTKTLSVKGEEYEVMTVGQKYRKVAEETYELVVEDLDIPSSRFSRTTSKIGALRGVGRHLPGALKILSAATILNAAGDAQAQGNYPLMVAHLSDFINPTLTSGADFFGNNVPFNQAKTLEGKLGAVPITGYWAIGNSMNTIGNGAGVIGKGIGGGLAYLSHLAFGWTDPAMKEAGGIQNPWYRGPKSIGLPERYRSSPAQ